MSVQDMEALLEVKVFQDTTTKNIVEALKRGEWIRFIVNKNWNIIVGFNNHDELIYRSGSYDPLIPDGYVQFRIYNEKEPEFGYHYFREYENIRIAAEEKLKKWIALQGITSEKNA